MLQFATGDSQRDAVRPLPPGNLDVRSVTSARAHREEAAARNTELDPPRTIRTS